MLVLKIILVTLLVAFLWLRERLSPAAAPGRAVARPSDQAGSDCLPLPTIVGMSGFVEVRPEIEAAAMASAAFDGEGRYHPPGGTDFESARPHEPW
jgi:hypothetical protein